MGAALDFRLLPRNRFSVRATCPVDKGWVLLSLCEGQGRPQGTEKGTLKDSQRKKPQGARVSGGESQVDTSMDSSHRSQ